MQFKGTLLIAVNVAFLTASPAASQSRDHGLLEQSLAVSRIDGSQIEVLISRPSTDQRIPIVLAIDGSLCVPSRMNASMSRLLPPTSGPKLYALVTVEKPGPSMPEVSDDGSIRIGPEFRCSDTFKKYYSIDERVVDHLRAIQYLRRHANWWDGRLYLWGFSDGARIAGRVGAFTPETKRIVLGGFGGGSSMAKEFEDFHVCAENRTEARETCLRDLRSQLDEMRNNPTPMKSWNGDANTWKVWASRLDGVEANILRDLTIPVLVFHGTEDSSTPVASARLLADRLSAPGGPPFEYREIEGMGHGLGSRLTPDAAESLHREFLQWLLEPAGKAGRSRRNLPTR